MILLILMALVSPAKAEALRFEALSPSAYARLDKKTQKLYVDKLRKSWISFEKKYPLPTDKKSSLIDLLIDSAYAEDHPCIIGGNTLVAVKASNGRYLCPTTGRKCEGVTDGFKCGDIFGGVCISRTPIASLSERCYQGSTEISDKAEYERMVRAMAGSLDTLCGSSKPSHGCQYLALKMNEATSEMNIKLAELDRYNQRNPSRSPGDNSSSNPDFQSVDAPGAATQSLDLGRDGARIAEENKKAIEYLTTTGCRGAGPRLPPNPRPRLRGAEISGLNGEVLFGEASRFQTIIVGSELIEKKSDTEATYSVRMLKYNYTKIPPELEYITVKIHQKNGEHTLTLPGRFPQKVRIKDTPINNIVLSRFRGYQHAFESLFRMADDCLLREDIVAIRSEGNPSSRPGSGSGSAGSR